LFSKESITYLKNAIQAHKVSRAPIDLQILPTTRCNAKCIFCPTQAVSKSEMARFAPRWLEEPMDINHGVFERLVDDLYRLGAPKRVHLTGGEPLLYKKIIPMLFVLRGTFPQTEINLVTNGILLKEFASVLVKLGINRVSISINAGTRQSFAKQFQVPENFFDQVKAGIKLIGKERGKKPIPQISLTAVLNKVNFKEPSDLLQLALETQADAITYLALMDFPFSEEEKRNSVLTENEFQEFRAELAIAKQKAQKHGIYLGFTGNSLYQGRLRAEEIYKKTPCYAGYTFAMVWPDGSIRACCNCEAVLGNLSQRSFYQIWNSAEAQMIRERMFKIPELGPPELCDCLECGYLFENQEYHRLLTANE